MTAQRAGGGRPEPGSRAGREVHGAPQEAEEPGVPRPAPLLVEGTTPSATELSYPRDGVIEVRFSERVDPDTLTSRTFHAFGRWSGPVHGSFELAQGGRVVRLVPDGPFSAGERVLVVLSDQLRSREGGALREEGYSFLFWTAAEPASLTFTPIQTVSCRSTPSEPVKTYGGFATDLNGDGWLDLGMTNETSGDLRTFLNLADGTGRMGPLIEPTFPTDAQSSPNEPADFNHDGLVDVCIANPNGGTVSILLGNGDGTFQPQQLIPVGLLPRGVCVVDVEGDGDMDVVNTNAATDELSVLLNDGNGVFADPVFVSTGVQGVWAIAACEMTGDGILDLVVGSRPEERVLVLRGDGAGSFELLTNSPAGALVWNVSTGDLNGDGHEDVALAGGLSDVGTVLFGDGTGGLSAPTLYASDGWCTATDLGDMDGDGDLDLNLSSFFGDYRFYVNDGQGAFTFDQFLDATSAASCSIMADLTGDGRLDFALVDENDDTVTLLEGGP